MLLDSSILDLAEQPVGWGPKDRVVVASTDYSMHQAEEFTLLPCPQCQPNQVRVKGKIHSHGSWIPLWVSEETHFQMYIFPKFK